MKTLLRLCALVCLLSLGSFGQDIWGSLPPAADCIDGFSVTLKPQNPYSPQGGSFQLPGTYVCHTHAWYWQPPKVDSLKFYDNSSMATGSASAAWGAITGTLSAQTDLVTALGLKAPLASPTFTGTVGGITKSMVGLGSVDNTSDAGKPVSTAQQTALDLKANLASPTLTGTVTLGTCQVLSGSASPESAVAAPVCSLYLRTDGGAGTTLYVKESGAGNTGWVGK